MNWNWGTHKYFHRGVDDTKNNEGPPPVQNIGVNEGYEGVLTAGLYDCFGLALIEREIATGNITRISMAHIISEHWDDQIKALSEHLLDKFQPESTLHNRIVILFPGEKNASYVSRTMGSIENMLTNIANILSVERNKIFMHNDCITSNGNYSACVTFDVHAGNGDYLEIEFDRSLKKADLKIMDSQTVPKPTSDLIHVSLSTEKYNTLIHNHDLLKKLAPNLSGHLAGVSKYYSTDIHAEDDFTKAVGSTCLYLRNEYSNSTKIREANAEILSEDNPEQSPKNQF